EGGEDGCRRLKEELPCPVALLLRDQPDRDEGIEKRDREVVCAEGRHEDPVERREPLREGRGAARRPARLRVERRRVKKGLSHERPHGEQIQPERSGREELSPLHGEESGKTPT